MTSLSPIKYQPIPENEAVYNRLYALYWQMHGAFGGVNKAADLSGAMKELIRIREAQTHA
jgi:L-ribulokinase